MAGVIAISPKFTFLSSTGAPLVNGTVDVYVAGTVTRSNTWADQAQTTLNANPIVLDSRGEAVIWLDPAITYDFVLKNSGGVTQYTAEDIVGSGSLTGLTFTQSGTGAVSRSAQDKMRERVSLEDFGGSPALADNKAAFDLAIATGYSTIYLKADTYITSPLTITDRRVKFEMQSGPLGTSVGRKAVIKLINSAASHLITVTGDNSKLHLENVSLDGNKANQSSTNHGIYCPAATVFAESVELICSQVRNCKGDGINLGRNRNRLHAMVRTYIAENDGYGLYSVGAQDHKVADSEFGDNGLANVYIDGDTVTQASNMVFTNTESYNGGLLNTTNPYNVYIGGRCSEFSWLGGDCLGARQHGVYIVQLALATQSSISIHGVRMFGNSRSSTGVYSDVFDDRGGSTFVALKHTLSSSSTPKYLYEVGSNATQSLQILGAIYKTNSYGTAFTNNFARTQVFDDKRVRFVLDHPGMSFLHNTPSTTLISSFDGTTGQTLFTLAADGQMFFGGGSGAVDLSLFRQKADVMSIGATDSFNARTGLWITDGVTAPGTEAGTAIIFVDTADGDLKVRFGDGTLKTIVTDT